MRGRWNYSDCQNSVRFDFDWAILSGFEFVLGYIIHGLKPVASIGQPLGLCLGLRRDKPAFVWTHISISFRGYYEVAGIANIVLTIALIP